MMVTDTRARSRKTAERDSVAEAELIPAVHGILNRHPAVGLAIGVVREGRLVSFYGHGLADIASGRPVTEDTAFRIASITKTFSTLAAMQLWERGVIDLDAPAQDYLRAYRLVPANADWRPATVRHLMTHTAGIPETVSLRDVLRPDWGESVPVGRPLPSLAEFYGGALRLQAEPGTRFVYGNHSPATVGQIVEDVSGRPLDRFFREEIFEPLGMEDSDLVRSERIRSRLATGYSLGGDGPRAVAPREFITTGAASIYSTPRDMARYAAALLGGGANDHGRVLQPATVAAMFEPHHRTDPRLVGMGLGFMRLNLAGRIAVEHQGMMSGFHSQLTLMPDAGIGVIAFTNGAKDPSLWLPAECAGLLRQVAGLPADPVRTDIPERPQVWSDIIGWYRLDAGLNDVRLRGVCGLGVEVFVRGEALAFRFLAPIPALYRGFPLRADDPTDPYAYRLDMSDVGMGTSRVVFSEGPAVGTRTIHLELMPLALPRQPARTNPRRLAIRALLGAGMTAAALAVRRRPRPIGPPA